MFSRFPVSLAFALCVAAPLSAETVNIETAVGPAEVPANPETIAVFDMAALDAIDALGITVAGVPQPHYLSYLDDAAATAQSVGSLFEPDFEALAMIAPDLIVAGGRSSTQVDALSRIAPTIDMTIWDGDYLDVAQARVRAYGEIFGKQDDAEALASALVAKTEEAENAVEGRGDALILLTNGGKISAYGSASRFGWLHTALGLPEAYPGLESETHGEAVSFEFVAEVDPDWILVIDRGAAIGNSGESAAATLDNPLIAKTRAAKQGQIVYLDSGPLYIAGGGVQSMTHTLDEVIAAFSRDGN
ncbi:siderophore ABC transporter substrate-binding protein [Amaricoccus macauensis]|uniref:siderophore ABC transporter substrate-binding protein n=1 Tax=Amaricoccus macauensis TaxID=57001 RepID=UPI003C7ED83A